MLALISPAKKLDFECDWNVAKPTKPDLLKESKVLVDAVRELSKKKLQTLMKLSNPLAELNYNRFQDFATPFTVANARPAVTAFRGDTYVGLDADTLKAKDLEYAQKHLYILSGLYGLLRPLDLIQAYRLEMGTKLKNPRGKDLYDFWGGLITDAVNNAVSDDKTHKDKTIVSLASNEYIKALKPKDLKGAFVTCHFKEGKGTDAKVVGLFAKRARGMMARYIIQNRIESPKGLKDFNADGYKFVSSLSDDGNYVFTRSKQG